ncbi:hypothetical protein Fbal_1746 [Ferrimonas balearica DSM 9799]|uniref:Uncharacterized protein n=1 Tax=Ferrimonas balearica (strain DSM 9799 / CCM 4581 / KCTC 23876 / PAT) TaxID=550540 RepID=E1SRZ5_FERBD|nr:hypothetical protein Fbal_1746 [Ferrimonas balearica DSM 9799]
MESLFVGLVRFILEIPFLSAVISSLQENKEKEGCDKGNNDHYQSTSVEEQDTN